jgi:hypothetical protein
MKYFNVFGTVGKKERKASKKAPNYEPKVRPTIPQLSHTPLQRLCSLSINFEAGDPG